MSNINPPQPMKTVANGEGMNFISSLAYIKTARSAVRIQLAWKVALRQTIKNRIKSSNKDLKKWLKHIKIQKLSYI